MFVNNVQQSDVFNVTGSNPPAKPTYWNFSGASTSINTFSIINNLHTANILTLTATSTTDGTATGQYKIYLKGAF